MEQGPFCQSCSMPLRSPADFGTSRSGMRVNDYCSLCYAGGAFTEPGLSMQQMLDRCVPILVQRGMDEFGARRLMSSTLPRLRRWRSVDVDHRLRP